MASGPAKYKTLSTQSSRRRRCASLHLFTPSCPPARPPRGGGQQQQPRQHSAGASAVPMRPWLLRRPSSLSVQCSWRRHRRPAPLLPRPSPRPARAAPRPPGLLPALPRPRRVLLLPLLRHGVAPARRRALPRHAVVRVHPGADRVAPERRHDVPLLQDVEHNLQAGGRGRRTAERLRRGQAGGAGAAQRHQHTQQARERGARALERVGGRGNDGGRAPRECCSPGRASPPLCPSPRAPAAQGVPAHADLPQHVRGRRRAPEQSGRRRGGCPLLRAWRTTTSW